MVGLSPDPMRPSHFAAIYMQSEGYEIVPVNPRYAGQKILGKPVYASLSDIPLPGRHRRCLPQAGGVPGSRP